MLSVYAVAGLFILNIPQVIHPQFNILYPTASPFKHPDKVIHYDITIFADIISTKRKALRRIAEIKVDSSPDHLLVNHNAL